MVAAIGRGNQKQCNICGSLIITVAVGLLAYRKGPDGSTKKCIRSFAHLIGQKKSSIFRILHAQLGKHRASLADGMTVGSKVHQPILFRTPKKGWNRHGPVGRHFFSMPVKNLLLF